MRIHLQSKSTQHDTNTRICTTQFYVETHSLSKLQLLFALWSLRVFVRLHCNSSTTVGFLLLSIIIIIECFQSALYIAQVSGLFRAYSLHIANLCMCVHSFVCLHTCVSMYISQLHYLNKTPSFLLPLFETMRAHSTRMTVYIRVYSCFFFISFYLFNLLGQLLFACCFTFLLLLLLNQKSH